MMIKICSLESSKPYLFAQYLKNIIQALLRYVIIAQSNPISYHTKCIFLVAELVVKKINLRAKYPRNDKRGECDKTMQV